MKLSEASLNLAHQPPFQLSLSSFYDGGENALIRIEASDDLTVNHLPSTFVLTIDESGSMGEAALRHGDSEGTSGLSQLDVVKHAARTIVETLSYQDRLAIVAFSNTARVVLPLAYMTTENKLITSRKIDELRPLDCTNLYDGLYTALEMIRSEEVLPENANVMLLTDGLPNINPPRGELETLRSYLDAHPDLSVKISCFGFGYSLQSKLLSDIASLGGSIFSFIPDSSFVGTVFINSVSNLLSMAAPRGGTLKLEANDGIKIAGCTSGHRFTVTSWGMCIEIPSILYGQHVDVFVQLTRTTSRSAMDPFQATWEMVGLETPLVAGAEVIDPMDPEYGSMRQAAVRSALVSFIRTVETGKEVSGYGKEDVIRAQELLEETKWKVAKLADGTSNIPGIVALCQDLDGQITEAYSSMKYFRKWGGHYVKSLAGAHTLQQCTNFKDPGIQEYATGKFKMIRDASEQVFLQLAPPKPSRHALAPVTSMRCYHSASAPCFASGAVTLVNGNTVDVSEIVPGDTVKTSIGFARIRCVVETPIEGGSEHLVELDGGVLVTPWHPVRVAGGNKWVFPCFLAESQRRACNFVYSFVLDGDISLRIGSFDGIALGHGVQGDSILEHEYLGTERVILDLSKMVGWSEGRVRLSPNPAIRDATTGKITGFLQEHECGTTQIFRDVSFETSRMAEIEVH